MTFTKIIQKTETDCSIKWRMTSACNYNCSYCIQRRDGKLITALSRRDNGESIAERNARLSRTAIELSEMMEKAPHSTFTLKLIGGEVSLLDLPEILSHITTKKLRKVHVTTNLSASVDYWKSVRNSLPEGCSLRMECSYHEEFAKIDDFLAKVDELIDFASVSVETVSTLTNAEAIDELTNKMSERKIPFKIEADLRKEIDPAERVAKCRSGWVREGVGGDDRYLVTMEDGTVRKYAGRNKMLLDLAEDGHYLTICGHICTTGWNHVDIFIDKACQRSQGGECHLEKVLIPDFVWMKPLPCAGGKPMRCSLCGDMSLIGKE